MEQRAGTYDAIGYRISAGSLIGRSTAHGRNRSAPVTTDLLRKNVDSFYTLSCPTPDAPHSLHSFLPPSRPSSPPSEPRSLSTTDSSPFLFLDHPSPDRSGHPFDGPRHTATAPSGFACDRRTNGREKEGELVFFIGAVRHCLFVRSGMNALSKKWLVDGTPIPLSIS